MKGGANFFFKHISSFHFFRSLYNEPLTPSSNPTLSPGGSPLREGSTLPSPADWSEFINASNSKVERDLAQLTLSDPEQRELYEAARLVQTAFRKYKVQDQRSAVLQSAVTGTGVFGFGLKRLQSLTSVWSYGVLKSEVHLELVVWKCAGTVSVRSC